MDEQQFLARVRKAVARTAPHFGSLMNDHVRDMRRHGAASGASDTGHEPATLVASAPTGGAAEAAPDPAPQYLGELLGLPDPHDQPGLIAHWMREFSHLGGHPVVVEGGAQAVAALGAKIQDVLARRPGHAAITAHPLLAAWGLADALRAAGVPVIVYRSIADRPQLAAASVGVAVVSAAVAETGTFVIESNTQQGRTSSLLPPVFIGVVPPGQVVPGVAGWLAGRGARFRAGEEMPSSTVFATGPSRSADIAGDLALGVHGPGEVHAVLLRG